GNTDYDLVAIASSMDLHTTLFGEATSIAKQIDEDLADARPVAVYWRQFAVNRRHKFDPLGLEEGTHCFRRCVDNLLHIYPILVQRHASHRDLAQVEYVVDEPRQMLAVAQNDVDVGHQGGR